MHTQVPCLVIEHSGAFVKKWIVPHSWDPWAPGSLLGCQMSDSCPADLLHSHPAAGLQRAAQRLRDAGASPGPAEEEEADEEDEGLPRSAEAPCWARTSLALASLLGIVLAGAVIAFPVTSYLLSDVWRLPSLACAASGNGTGVTTDGAARSLLPPVTGGSRALAVDGHRADGHRALLEPAAGGAGAGGGGAAVLQTLQSALQSALGGLARRALSDDASGLGLGLGRWDPGAVAVNDGVRGVLFCSIVVVAISTLGLLLSCCPAGHCRGALTGLYLCCGIPCLTLLVFVATVEFTLREQARRRTAAQPAAQ